MEGISYIADLLEKSNKEVFDILSMEFPIENKLKNILYNIAYFSFIIILLIINFLLFYE